MLTIAETKIFSRYVSDYWTEEERGELLYGLQNILTQVMLFEFWRMSQSKMGTQGIGKSGGVRIIYYNMLEDGTICCY